MSRNEHVCDDSISGDEVDLHQALVKRQVHKRIREMQADNKKIKQDMFEAYKVPRVIARQGWSISTMFVSHTSWLSETPPFISHDSEPQLHNAVL